MTKIHFVGAAGSGVSALAQYHAMGGGHATGSDRLFDQGGGRELAQKLKAAGVVLYPQDGSALRERPDEVVASTAIEEDNTDISAAKKIGLPIIHRADFLARYVAERKTIAVAGTSGKSTVVAMIYEILKSSGMSPSVITGGALVSLEKTGLIGNAFRGESNLLIVEADESDGTLVKYKPWLGVLLNVSKDHKEVGELMEMFSIFMKNSSSRLVNADAPEFERFWNGSSTFGLKTGSFKPVDVRLDPKESLFSISNTRFRLRLPGLHNVENAVSAAAACAQIGIAVDVSSKALEDYQGVARRFQRIGEAAGVEVIDDFAHNPAKVAATLAAAHLRAARIHAVFQLHGYAPAKFLRQEFIDMFVASLAQNDSLWMPEIYYAGGTASKTISAKDITEAIRAKGRDARFVENRKSMIPELVQCVRSGDLILVMGARDPSLPDFAREILANLSVNKTSKSILL